MKWISVIDRLPEDFLPVIVLTFIGKIDISSVQIGNITQADQSMIEVRDWHDMVNAQVTHWMPLPELPKK